MDGEVERTVRSRIEGFVWTRHAGAKTDVIGVTHAVIMLDTSGFQPPPC